MRAYGLDEAQLIVLFPLSLSGTTHHWYTSFDSSYRRTWEDLAQDFLQHFAFNTGVDVQVINRPTKREQIQMVLRRLQPKIARHVIKVSFTDFGYLVMTFLSVDDGLARGL